jgi:hypothetical protein
MFAIVCRFLRIFSSMFSIKCFPDPRQIFTDLDVINTDIEGGESSCLHIIIVLFLEMLGVHEETLGEREVL